ncbi:hypothetical protein [Adhaeribacter rhizoryzae]|uniref:Lipoprotein n=1 Tax=Adhaeribacter rhizoryzae TaxID=2607907 RepID=A0A5M6DFQ5_9BACT|nr:hypothetical protein [Adhaeribacter rhizoryzae]KAA5546404.1 hypothetical protein F0145_10945 [Adhaeribacter rhizoryzae]
MRKIIYLYQFGLLVLVALVTGCSTSRTITASGKVTPQGKFKLGYNSAFNIATAPLAEIDDVTRAAVNAIKNRDSLYLEDVQPLTEGLLAYSLDPVGTSSEFYLRYGLVPRVDVGYKYASGAHVFDAMYQFLGATGTPANPGPTGLYGSIGLQYSGQNSNLPSKLGLSALSSILNYELSRKDILIPLVFSHSLGPEEEIGNISWGLVYSHSFIKYGFAPGKLFRKYADNVVEKVNPFMNKENYASYGAFLNAKLGYKYAYVVPAISIYYQNYGNYEIFGLQSRNYKGVTIVPSLGLQFNLGYDKKR